VGKTPGTWASYRQDKTEYLLSQHFDFLLRRLRHQKANAAQFFVSENDLLALVILFEVTQA
jgi:hypothetical protein